MTPDKRLEMACESFYLQRVVNVMPADYPSIRELRIQITKLLRLVLERPHPKELDPHRLFYGESSKKVKKRQGRHDAQCGEQFKKVRAMFEKSTKEYFRRTKPMTNAEFQTWRQKFYTAIGVSAAKMRKEITETVVPQVAKTKFFSRIGKR